MLNIHKRSWLGLSLSLAAILGVTACSSNEDSSTQQAKADKVATTTTEQTSKQAATTTTTTTTAATEQEANAENTLAPTVQTEIVDPNNVFLGRKVYLRGEMNDYGVQEAYELKEVEDNNYCTLAPLRADWSPYRFKFADQNWTAGTNFGFATPPAIIREGSDRVQLNPNSRFEEIRYEPEQDGIYRFCIEFEDKVPYATVTFMEKSRLTTMRDVIDHSIERMVAKNYQIKQEALLAKAEINAEAELAALAASDHDDDDDKNEVMEVAAVSTDSDEVSQ